MNSKELPTGGLEPARTAGRPYFMMELIDGEPIDLYDERRKLPVQAAPATVSHCLPGGSLR
ncbi:hypothetical protein OOT46_28565 [Aquabacterium sp. A7-Y]|uniref:hypothetical protein n=1 Tax=Aquabacterium sp. A7-Y TaxID=1349605 RepID=UPI00223DA9B7|nr:hypothetical protein [Aquabacterium sp. A7-Y]MCW7541756.1 hypothetical protein [Aquabacterium sp. A7-Y]